VGALARVVLIVMKTVGKSRRTHIKSESVSSRHGGRDALRAADGTPVLPLRGLRVLVGRARHQASVLSSGLSDLGAEVLEIPLIEIRKPRSYKSLDRALQNLSDYDWLILTSVNGVEALWQRLRKLRIDPKHLGYLNIAAIGSATGRAIEDRGLKVNVVPKEYVAESVVASLRRKVKGKRVLLARARVARDVIPRELRKLGARVDVVEAYETIVPQSSGKRLRAAMTGGKNRPDVITFTSSSTARNFVALLATGRGRGRPRHTDEFDGVLLASIGPVTSSTLRGLGLRVDIEAREYAIPGLIEAIVVHLKERV
jgi:uroporphyrinogen-III synthase